MKRQIFVKEFLTNGENATEAAIKAGFGRTRGSARSAVTALMALPQIRQAIIRARAEQEKDLEKKAAILGITREKMLVALAKTAFSDITDFLTITEDKGKIGDEDFVPGGLQLKGSEFWKAGGGRVVKRVKPGANGTLELELEARHPARELICKMLGWTKDQMEVSGPDGGPIQTANLVVLSVEERRAELERLQEILKSTEVESNG